MGSCSEQILAGARPSPGPAALTEAIVKWFRFHSECLNSSKIQKLPAELFRHWVNLLCLASKTNGYLPSAPDIAFHLRLKDSEVSPLIDALSSDSVNLIDRFPRLRMHDWDHWQFQSDSSTERVKKHRKKQFETFQKRYKNVAVKQNGNDFLSGSGSVSASGSESVPEETTKPEGRGEGEPEGKPNGASMAALAIAIRPEVVDSTSPTYIFSELEPIYHAAGVPIATKHKQLCIQLLTSIEPPEKRHCVIDYVVHCLRCGRWRDPSTTKGLLNLLRDGDWDVPIVARAIPQQRRPTAGEQAHDQATRGFLASRGDS